MQGLFSRNRYYWEIGKVRLRCSYDVITSPAHESLTATALLATALHAACSVTGARYRETGKTALGVGVHCPCPSASNTTEVFRLHNRDFVLKCLIEQFSHKMDCKSTDLLSVFCSSD